MFSQICFAMPSCRVTYSYSLTRGIFLPYNLNESEGKFAAVELYQFLFTLITISHLYTHLFMHQLLFPPSVSHSIQWWFKNQSLVELVIKFCCIVSILQLNSHSLKPCSSIDWRVRSHFCWKANCFKDESWLINCHSKKETHRQAL